MAHNIQVPIFGAASGSAAPNFWGDVDNLDVDMLAEYLLDDGTFNANGVTFDFIDIDGKHDSTMVSPENSEDGNLPTVAEANAAAVAYQRLITPAAGTYMSHQMPVQTITTQAMLHHGGVPLAPAPPGTVYDVARAGLGMLEQPHHPAPPHLVESAQKRRRLENSAANEVISSPNTLHSSDFASAAELAMQDTGRSRRKSQAQVDRRRERNRILARRTRLRKKFFFESLQKEVMDLQRENEMLKDVVKEDIGGDDSKRILETCDAAERMPPGVLEACCAGGFDFDSQDFSLVKSIQDSQHSFIITDPSLTDNPIVFASDGFLEITGYERDQVLGRNCRFLQGTETSKESLEEIREAVKTGSDVSITMINYTASGTPFWNKLFIAALRDAQNNIVNFIGVIVKVATPEPGHPEHGRLLDGCKLSGDDTGAESAMLAMEEAMSAAGGIQYL